MNRNTLQLFYFSVRGIIILTILYLILLFLPLLIKQEPEWRPSITSYSRIESPGGFLYDLCGLVFFLLTPLILILFNCFHDYASRSVKIFSSIALCLIVSSTVLRTFSYISQFELRDFSIHTQCKDSLIYHTYSFLDDFSTSVTFMAVTVFWGSAEFFIIPLFSKTNNIEKNIRLTLFFAGIFNLLGALGFILDKEGISASFILVSLIFFTIFSILCIKFFKRSKSQEYEG
jgi:hypothetical protein